MSLGFVTHNMAKLLTVSGQVLYSADLPCTLAIIFLFV